MVRIKRLLVIVGPTAVGKTSYGIELAALLNGEIVSADSRCLYRGMDTGTAKPNSVEMARVPHHLINVTTPDEPWSLAKYIRAATRCIDEIQMRDRLPVLVGGTGQYVRAILEGWNIPPRPDDDGMRSALEEISRMEGGDEMLHKQLKSLDPDAAASIDSQNIRRVIRALEVCLLTGRSFTEQRGKTPPPYDVFVIGLSMPREILFTRIDARIDAMLQAGWVEEVRCLIELGYDWNLPAMSALGYRQINSYIRGDIDLTEARIGIQKATRRLVRQQAAWFSIDDAKIHWYEVDKTTLRKIMGDINDWRK